MERLGYVFVDVMEGVRHAKLPIKDESFILRSIYAHKDEICKMFVKKGDIDRISMHNDIIRITEVTLYDNGLYIKIEQPRKIDFYDIGEVVLIIMSGDMNGYSGTLLCVMSADHGRYVIDNYEEGLKKYHNFYDKLGNKVKIMTDEELYEDLLKKEKAKPLFKRRGKDSLRAEVHLTGEENMKLLDKYFKSIDTIIEERFPMNRLDGIPYQKILK